MLLIEKAFPENVLAELMGILAKGSYVDGRNTASSAVESVKDNAQLDFRDPGYAKADGMVRQHLVGIEALQEYAIPVRSSNVLFSRYQPGMAYGDHVDAPMMRSGGQLIRADVSFTLFLCSPDEYEGGELVVSSMGAETVVKAQRGDVVAYPSDSLHHVNAITSGCRQVAVGWLQSLISSVEKRQIIYDLSLAKRLAYEESGKSEQFDLMSKSFVNLKRMWGQP
jgi:PKHD-type hydroxylase